MLRFPILVAALAALFTSQVSLAQTQSDASQSSSAVTVEAITGPITQAPPNETITYGGHEWTTPAVGGSYFGGANPCLIGTGGGAAGGPIGFSINLGHNDQGCQRRSDAAAWHAMGFDNVAIARMCQDVHSADAFFAATGEACPGAEAHRYKLADGSDAPVATLVATSRAIPNNPNGGPIDLNNPAVQAAIRAEAQRMLLHNGQSAPAGAPYPMQPAASAGPSPAPAQQIAAATTVRPGGQ